MASGFFAVLDDISALMDDVATMSKVATKKTAGILGDDLAVNAEKATGFLSSREIPVLWAITKGSFLNKLIIPESCSCCSENLFQEGLEAHRNQLFYCFYMPFWDPFFFNCLH